MGAVAFGGAVRVLVVEDDAFTRMTLARVVASLGYEVVGQAGTVVEAMDRARGTKPDVAPGRYRDQRRIMTRLDRTSPFSAAKYTEILLRVWRCHVNVPSAATVTTRRPGR